MEKTDGKKEAQAGKDCVKLRQIDGLVCGKFIQTASLASVGSTRISSRRPSTMT